MAIRKIYITPTKQMGYVDTLTPKPNEPVGPKKVARYRMFSKKLMGLTGDSSGEAGSRAASGKLPFHRSLGRIVA
jgi:hypothetical protein